MGCTGRAERHPFSGLSPLQRKWLVYFESLKTNCFAFFFFETGSFDIFQAVLLPLLGYRCTLPCVALKTARGTC